jgi:hypothetical protein
MSRQPDISDPNRCSFSCRAGAKAESVNEIVEEFLGTRGGDGDHLVGQVSHKSAENVEMIRPATSSYARVAYGFSIGDGCRLACLW